MALSEERRKNMFIGPFVADAAAMGLHWIYAQPKIRRIAPEQPEFLEPDPKNYEGVPAYFAHKGKHAGDLSMYGEGALVLLRSITEHQRFDWSLYSKAFEDHFGFGGEYVGYIDTPTRITLTNRIKQQEHLLEKAMSVPFEGDEKAKSAVASKVLGNSQLHRGDALREKVHEAIRLTKGTDDQLALADNMIAILEGSREYPGADDVQLPALTKVPILVAAYCNDPQLEMFIEEAVRVTNDNDTAVEWALYVGRLMKWALDDDSSIDQLEEVVVELSRSLSSEIVERIDDMLQRKNDDNKKVTMKLGPACELRSGVPVALHNLLGSRSFVDAARKNIYGCGDSCGRAIVVGGIGGALYSDIPDSWKTRVTKMPEIEKMIASRQLAT